MVRISIPSPEVTSLSAEALNDFMVSSLPWVNVSFSEYSASKTPIATLAPDPTAAYISSRREPRDLTHIVVVLRYQLLRIRPLR